jgi:hydrogenase/urease accessory protein HupE
MSPLLRCILTAFAFFAASAPAQAHLVETRLGDFYGGMLHPLTGFEDPLPWLALAILAAFQDPKQLRWLLLVFPLGLLAGGALSLVFPTLPFVTMLSLTLFVLIGLCVAVARTLPSTLLIGLGLTVGLTHGYQNGQAMTDSTDHLLFILGVTSIGYVMVMMVTASAIAFLQGQGARQGSWRAIALRAAGSWIAAIGLMVFGVQFLAPRV